MVGLKGLIHSHSQFMPADDEDIVDLHVMWKKRKEKKKHVKSMWIFSVKRGSLTLGLEKAAPPSWFYLPSPSNNSSPTTTTFNSYGDLWRNLRRITTIQIFSSASLHRSSDV
ncbi:hypothetical protein HYC85_005441 [Camellia sinensis]|uniref:Uncharacterized protein n=1 Tax=Camellia sinensis TaxID=4442 RepID=A0A7J7I1C2_CAMSI|nr:hypothetical protein HYC85_005441 [Camellia sinensis]